jgi:putative transposase
MSRLPWVVATGLAHHVTQRGTDRQPIFSSGRSQDVYLDLLKEHAHQQRLRILGYCLMTNHVHVLALPERADSLAVAFRNTHGRFAQYANALQCRTGHFWQNRFYSCPVEDCHTGRVMAYIELNPVRAGLVSSAAEYPWSSAAVHLGLRSELSGLVDLQWWSDRWTKWDWSAFLGDPAFDAEAVRMATHTGRPLGSTEFVADLEHRLGRKLARQKGGRPKQSEREARPEQRFMIA